MLLPWQKETVKKHRHSAHEFWAQHRLLTSWWIPTWDVEGCGPKICKFIFVSRDTIPHPAWLAARFTHLHEPPPPPTFLVSLFLSLSFQSLPYVTINETCLLYSPVTMEQSRWGTKGGRGTQRLCYPLRGHTYASSLPGAKFSSIPIHVPRYILPREERRGEERRNSLATVLRQDTGSSCIPCRDDSSCDQDTWSVLLSRLRD